MVELVRLSPVITDEGKQQAAECTQIIARFGVPPRLRTHTSLDLNSTFSL